MKRNKQQGKQIRTLYDLAKLVQNRGDVYLNELARCCIDVRLQKMKPLLAHKFEPHRWTSGPAHIQPKLNGVRALYADGHFQSRDEMPWNKNVLKHISELLRRHVPPSVILDGELYRHGWPLQRINGAVSVARTEPIEDTLEVCYHIFDYVDFSCSFGARWGTLKDQLGFYIEKLELKGFCPIKLVPTVKVTEQADADLLYSKYVSDGYEGIVYRLGACPYTIPKQEGPGGRLRWLSDKDNRVWHMLKRKDWQDDEFVCVRVVEGEGKRSGMVGAFMCLTRGAEKLFTVGSGLTDSDALHYFLNPPVGRKIKVKYLTLSSDGIPLNPTVLAVL